tara:strand:- start:1925 stop:6433 length:4509 start_codon:yes stop_codon:yes gene_type:complete
MPHFSSEAGGIQPHNVDAARVKSLLPLYLREAAATSESTTTDLSLIGLLEDYYKYLNSHGLVTKLSVVTASSGFSDTTNAVATGGSGEELTINFEVGTDAPSGRIINVTPNNPGLNYRIGDIITYQTATFEVTGINAGPTDVVNSILAEHDPDLISDEFITRFQQEIAKTVPDPAKFTKKSLYKKILKYYQTRGSQESIETFFKIFFDTDITVFLPKDYLFRTSDSELKQALSANDVDDQVDKDENGNIIIDEDLDFNIIRLSGFEAGARYATFNFADDWSVVDGMYYNSYRGYWPGGNNYIPYRLAADGTVVNGKYRYLFRDDGPDSRTPYPDPGEGAHNAFIELEYNSSENSWGIHDRFWNYDYVRFTNTKAGTVDAGSAYPPTLGSDWEVDSNAWTPEANVNLGVTVAAMTGSGLIKIMPAINGTYSRSGEVFTKLSGIGAGGTSEEWKIEKVSNRWFIRGPKANDPTPETITVTGNSIAEVNGTYTKITSGTGVDTLIKPCVDIPFPSDVVPHYERGTLNQPDGLSTQITNEPSLGVWRKLTGRPAPPYSSNPYGPYAYYITFINGGIDWVIYREAWGSSGGYEGGGDFVEYLQQPKFLDQVYSDFGQGFPPVAFSSGGNLSWRVPKVSYFRDTTNPSTATASTINNVTWEYVQADANDVESSVGSLDDSTLFRSRNLIIDSSIQTSNFVAASYIPNQDRYQIFNDSPMLAVRLYDNSSEGRPARGRLYPETPLRFKLFLENNDSPTEFIRKKDESPNGVFASYYSNTHNIETRPTTAYSGYIKGDPVSALYINGNFPRIGTGSTVHTETGPGWGVYDGSPAETGIKYFVKSTSDERIPTTGWKTFAANGTTSDTTPFKYEQYTDNVPAAFRYSSPDFSNLYHENIHFVVKDTSPAHELYPYRGDYVFDKFQFSDRQTEYPLIPQAFKHELVYRNSSNSGYRLIFSNTQSYADLDGAGAEIIEPSRTAAQFYSPAGADANLIDSPNFKSDSDLAVFEPRLSGETIEMRYNGYPTLVGLNRQNMQFTESEINGSNEKIIINNEDATRAGREQTILPNSTGIGPGVYFGFLKPGKVYYTNAPNDLSLVETTVDSPHDPPHQHMTQMPFIKGGKKFGSASIYPGKQRFYIHALEAANIKYYDNISTADSATTDVDLSAGDQQIFTSATDGHDVSNPCIGYIISTGNILCSTATHTGTNDSPTEIKGTETLISLGTDTVFKRSTAGDSSPVANLVYDLKLNSSDDCPSISVTDYGNYSFATSTVGEIFAAAINDGAGDDMAGGMTRSQMGDIYIYANKLSDYTIISPYTNEITVKYMRFEQTDSPTTFDVHTVNGTTDSPARYQQLAVTNDSPADAGSDHVFIMHDSPYVPKLWKFEGRRPFALIVNTFENELVLEGHVRNQYNQTVKRVISAAPLASLAPETPAAEDLPLSSDIFENAKGRLSDYYRLQDMNYWQDYSYEIRSTLDPSEYTNVFEDFAHPAGFKYFTKQVDSPDTIPPNPV